MPRWLLESLARLGVLLIVCPLALVWAVGVAPLTGPAVGLGAALALALGVGLACEYPARDRSACGQVAASLAGAAVCLLLLIAADLLLSHLTWGLTHTPEAAAPASWSEQVARVAYSGGPAARILTQLGLVVGVALLTRLRRLPLLGQVVATFAVATLPLAWSSQLWGKPQLAVVEVVTVLAFALALLLPPLLAGAERVAGRAQPEPEPAAGDA